MITIQLLTQNDISLIVTSFAEHHWPKPYAIFETYLQEQASNQRSAWVAYKENELAGYVTLKWQSLYSSFRDQNIPEIMDLNVLPPFRGKGIGSKLLSTAENECAKKYPIVGIGVGLYSGYGTAHKLYIAKNYIPDGLGMTYRYRRVKYGEEAPLDDDLIIWFTKNL